MLRISDKLTRVSLEEANPCQVRWAGETLHLLPERALWWPAQRVLFIADLHLGKAATYRALGQPVPGGTTQQNLARLDRLIESHRPLQFVFLGDFLHAAQARTPQVLAALASVPGLRLHRTDVDGRVVIESDGRAIRVRSQR